MLRDGDLALRAAYLFCFNPASAFYRRARARPDARRGAAPRVGTDATSTETSPFSAVYSESLFAFLTFSGALSLAADSPSRAAVAFFAASAARSNGAQPAEEGLRPPQEQAR